MSVCLCVCADRRDRCLTNVQPCTYKVNTIHVCSTQEGGMPSFGPFMQTKFMPGHTDDALHVSINSPSFRYAVNGRAQKRSGPLPGSFFFLVVVVVVVSLFLPIGTTSCSVPSPSSFSTGQAIKSIGLANPKFYRLYFSGRKFLFFGLDLVEPLFFLFLPPPLFFE